MTAASPLRTTTIVVTGGESWQKEAEFYPPLRGRGLSAAARRGARSLPRVSGTITDYAGQRLPDAPPMNLVTWLERAARARRAEPAIHRGDAPWATYGELAVRV